MTDLRAIDELELDETERFYAERLATCLSMIAMSLRRDWEDACPDDSRAAKEWQKRRDERCEWVEQQLKSLPGFTFPEGPETGPFFAAVAHQLFDKVEDQRKLEEDDETRG